MDAGRCSLVTTAVVVDRRRGMVTANRPLALLTAGVAAHLLEPPVNVPRLACTLRAWPRARSTSASGAHLLAQRGRQAVVSGDPALAALHHEIAGYPAASARDVTVSERSIEATMPPETRVRTPHGTRAGAGPGWAM